ncbi:MAG: response regulator [Ruminococcaceae bacterium]|nr:response regulator [Oscillospiraceae bacterium]
MNLLLVDDEEMTRQGLIENIDFESIGIHNIKDCKNGKDALLAVKAFTPDILLTDIRMPKMTGIELAKEIHQIFPDCRIVFMSGYSDKEYLIEALKLKAVDYVEKPIVLEKISDTLKKAADEVLKSRSTSKITENADKVIKSTSHILKSELALVLTKPKFDNNKFINLVSLTNFEILATFYVITVVFKICDADVSIARETLTEITESILGEEKNDAIYTFKGDDAFVVTFCFKNKASVDARCVVNFANSLLEKANIKMFCSIGNAYPVESAYNSYQDATINLVAGFYKGYGKIVSVDLGNQTYDFDLSKIQAFEKCLIGKDRETAIHILKSIASDLKNYPATLNAASKNYFCKMALLIVNLKEEYNIKSDKEYAENILEVIFKFKTLDEIVDELIKEIDGFFACINIDSENNIVFKIKQYVKENYTHQLLSVSEISDYLGLNMSYACKIFRMRTGTTISRYITNYRIIESKKLLLLHNIAIRDIAVMVGFQNSNYFGKVFKKIEGMQPKEYRNKNML